MISAQRLLLAWSLAGSLLAWSLAGSLLACGNAPPPPPVPRAAEQPADLPPLSAPAWPQGRSFPGVLVARESVDVAAQSDGVLRAVAARVGDHVARGQLLATIDPTSIRDQLAIAEAAVKAADAVVDQAVLEVTDAKRKYERRVAEGGLVSREELASAETGKDLAVSALAVARAHSEEAQARVQALRSSLSRTEIRSPLDGTVAIRYVDPGAHVAPGSALLRVIDSVDLLLRFAVPPEEARALTPGSRVLAVLEPSGRRITGTIRHVAPDVDSPSQMVFVEAEIGSPGRGGEDLQAGSVARVVPADAASPPAAGAQPGAGGQ